MADLNRVYLIGNLTRDPEVRYTPSGKAVADIGMAVGRKYRTSDGQERDETCFVTIVVWGKQAEACGKFLSKGSPLLVEGRLSYEEWEKEGKKQSRLRVVASRAQFLGRPKSAEGRGAPHTEARVAPQVAEQSGDQPEAQAEEHIGEEVADGENLPF